MLNSRARAVLDALLPSGSSSQLPLGIFDVGFDRFYEQFRQEAVFSLRAGFRIALFVGAWIAPLLIRRLPPITRLPPVDRERALSALGQSRVYALRQMLLILKMTVCFRYGADAEVRRSVGYSPLPSNPKEADE